jgi:hypothetical protein
MPERRYTRYGTCAVPVAAQRSIEGRVRLMLLVLERAIPLDLKRAQQLDLR